MQLRNKNLFTPEEWEWLWKLEASYSDPEQRNSFEEVVVEKKKSNPNYSVFQDFPRDATPAPVSTAVRYCCEILESLKGHSREPISQPESLHPPRKQFGELIEQGKHLKKEGA